jgi:DNA end-binding protein Ku
LTMLRFANEVVDAPEMADVDRVKVAPKELKLAANLIEALAADWKPEQYKDDYQENLQEVINSKLKGETIELEADDRPMRAEVIDLAERLRASLKAAEGTRKTRGGADSKTSATKTRAKSGTKAKRKRAA